jgi:hypothetical protein
MEVTLLGMVTEVREAHDPNV